MKRVYKTANGKLINFDAIIAQNEETIAVGNMKVNARGDELGPGGKIERTKDQVMADYYKLNSPVATDTVSKPRKANTKKELVDEWVEPVKEKNNNVQAEEIVPETKPLRGSLANSVSKTTISEPEIKKSGPSRI